MEGASKIIALGFTLAFALAETGKLPQATHWMAQQALRAQPQFVSLGQFNRSLQSSADIHGRRKIKRRR